MLRRMLVLIMMLIVCVLPAAAQDTPSLLLYAVKQKDKFEMVTFDVASGKTAELPSISGEMKDAAGSPDGRFVWLRGASPSGSEMLTVYDTTTGASQMVTEELVSGCDNLLWWSPDSRALAYITVTADGDAFIHALDVYTGQALLSFPLWYDQSSALYPDWPSFSPWSPDSQSFAYADISEQVYVVDVASGTKTPVNAVPGPTIRWFSPERLAYKRTGNELIGVFNLSTGKENVYTGIYIANVSPDGRYFIISGKDNAKSMVDFTTGKQLQLDRGYSEVDTVWSPDSRYFVYGTNDTRLYDVTDGSSRVLVSVPHNHWSVRWSPVGHVVTFTRGQNDMKAKGIWIFDLDNDRIRRFDLPTAYIMQYRMPDIDWSLDGRYLSLETDVEIILFDRETWSRLEIPDVSRYPMWSPDGRVLANPVYDRAGSSVAILNVPDGSPFAQTDMTSGDIRIHLYGWLGADRFQSTALDNCMG